MADKEPEKQVVPITIDEEAVMELMKGRSVFMEHLSFPDTRFEVIPRMEGMWISHDELNQIRQRAIEALMMEVRSSKQNHD